MKLLFAIISFTSLGLFSCISHQLAVNPLPCADIEETKEAIVRVYKLQKSEFIPITIDVTNDYIEHTRYVATSDYATGATTVQPKTFRVYYKYIENLRIVKDNTGRNEIRFTNAGNREKHILFIYQFEDALIGYSAISCMIEYNAKK